MPNRFTRQTPMAQFSPMSFEQMSTVPLMLQKAHDQSLAAAEQQRANINSLPWHEKRAKELESKFDSDINNFVDELSSKGINGINSTKRLLDLKRKKEEMFGEGSEASKIQNAALQRKELQEKLAKQVEKNEISSLQAQKNLALFDKMSKESSDIGYNGRVLASGNVVDSTAEALRKIPTSTIEEQTNWRRDDRNGLWVNTVTEQTSRGTPEDLKKFALKYIQEDPELMSIIQDEALLDSEFGNLPVDSETGSVMLNGKWWNPEVIKNLPKSQLQSILMQDKINRTSNLAAQAAFKNDFSQRTKIKNMASHQLLNNGISTPGVLSTNFGGFFKTEVGDKKEAFKVERKFVDPKGNAVDPEKLKSDVADILKENGYEQYLGEDGLPSNEFMRYFTKQQMGDSGDFVSSGFDSGIRSVSKNFGDAFKILSSMNPTNPNPSGILLDKELFESLSGAMKTVGYSLIKKGYTREDLSEKEQKQYQAAMNQEITQNQSEYEEALGEKVGKNVIEFTKDYNNAVEQKREVPIGLFPTDKEFIPDVVNLATKNNNLSTLASVGEMLVLDKDGQSIESGKDLMTNKGEIDNSQIENISYLGQIAEGTPSEYYGGYKLAIQKTNGENYQIIVPSPQKNSHLTPAAQFQDLKLNVDMGSHDFIYPLNKLQTSDGKVYENITVTKVNGVDSDNQYNPRYVLTSNKGKDNEERIEYESDNGMILPSFPEHQIEKLIIR